MRKKFLLFACIVFLFSLGCKTSISALNKNVDRANKKAISESPFPSAKSMKTEIKGQLRYRDNYLIRFGELRNAFPNQPILLIERYSYICIDCVADFVTIYTDGVLFEYSFDLRQMKYLESKQNLKVEDLLFQDGYYDDIKEIIDNLDSGKNWSTEPEVFGNEDCYDGDQTFYTVFLPNKQIESMYMRCWLPKKLRQ